MIQAIRHIQPKPVDIKLVDPGSHAVENMPDHFFISKVQLHQIIVALPAFIPEAVVIIGISSQINMEPIQVRGMLPVFQHVLKLGKSSPYMIENTVQHDTDSIFMQLFAYLFKILIRPKSAVYLPVIPRIIPMSIRFKHRRKINCVYPQLLHMGDPIQYFQYP